MISLDLTEISHYIKKNLLPDFYEEDLVEEFNEIKLMLDKSYRNLYYYNENKQIIYYKISVLKNTIEENDKMYSMLSILEEDYKLLNKKSI
jgi:hypothetical protein